MANISDLNPGQNRLLSLLHSELASGAVSWPATSDLSQMRAAEAQGGVVCTEFDFATIAVLQHQQQASYGLCKSHNMRTVSWCWVVHSVHARALLSYTDQVCHALKSSIAAFLVLAVPLPYAMPTTSRHTTQCMLQDICECRLPGQPLIIFCSAPVLSNSTLPD